VRLAEVELSVLGVLAHAGAVKIDAGEQALVAGSSSAARRFHLPVRSGGFRAATGPAAAEASPPILNLS